MRQGSETAAYWLPDHPDHPDPPGERSLRLTVVDVPIDGPPPLPIGPVHRPSCAYPALASAAHPDPLRALVDTFGHACATFHERRRELIGEVRKRYAPPV
ncbi:hypothetical protein GCM10010123_07300 [Pilimelia anulata]|uniref:Uncharacterized protein n=1 Tax=Pilimelia anulata TaxID=53371 RepID=A0A8J3B3J0_9ACTN|nr:hypothetical protein [Pilimelia anulata]GGJ79988.1 hypothetical protein GCM10010123_07300 [Pilimelia anulata]